MTWVSKKPAFFGGNVMSLVMLIPIVCGLLLFLALSIITKKEEKFMLAAHESMKKNPPGFSGEKELANIAALIDGINQSLTRVQNTSQDILSLSKELSKIARQTTRPDPP
ncbi:MAG: hypothetical protein LBG25_03735, partial [Spirochaetaceae bacterium]|nr:hypothetical protein [Spirochaetaceae bacterium]